MGRFEPVRGLEAKVGKMVRPYVDEIAEEVERVAKKLAPPTKTWQSVLDSKTREPHYEIDQAEVPGNLRFTLNSMPWDMENSPLGVQIGPQTFMQEPKDLTSGAWVNSGMVELELVAAGAPANNCRCEVSADPQGIARHIRASEATYNARKVIATVTCTGYLVVQAEYGDDYWPGVPRADGAHFMGGAAKSVAAKRRARR